MRFSVSRSARMCSVILGKYNVRLFVFNRVHGEEYSCGNHKGRLRESNVQKPRSYTECSKDLMAGGNKIKNKLYSSIPIIYFRNVP